jgi:hypothetical protein
MSIQPVEIKDTILKDFTPTLDFAVQEDAGGIGSAGKTNGQKIIDAIGLLNLSNLSDGAIARANITQDLSLSRIYVDQYGDDANNSGSAISPFKSIAKAISYAKASGLSANNTYNCFYSGIIDDSSGGQIAIPPYFGLQGLTHNSYINNTQDIILDLPAWTITPDGLLYWDSVLTYGKVNFDFSTINGAVGFLSFKNISPEGDFTVKGHAGFVPDVYLYNSFMFYNFILDYINLYTDSASLGYDPVLAFTNTTVNPVDNALYLKPIKPLIITSNSQNLSFSTDVYFINNNGPGVYTLPLASGNGGKRITIKKISGSAFPIIVDAQIGENIDPAASFPVAQQYISITFYSDGISTWWII